MLFLSIVHHYFLWHYSRAWLELFNVWLNLMWFVVHFFSLPQLMRSWFSPFKRIVEGRGDTWNLEDLAGFIIIGLLSRVIGAVMRTVVIGLGLIALAVTVIGGLVVIGLWIAAPLLIFVLLAGGISLLFG